MDNWHEQIQATDNGVIKFGCGHGAEKNKPLLEVFQWCELCSNSIPRSEQARSKQRDYEYIKTHFNAQERDAIWRSIKSQHEAAPVRF